MVSISIISKNLQNGFNNNVLNRPLMNKIYKYASENPASFVSKTALLSALTKDAIGCAFYYTQAKNNKKMPEEKRNFQAALDLMNGILNIGIQLTIGMWIDKNSQKWFDLLPISKSLQKENTEKLSDDMLNKINKKLKQMAEKTKSASTDLTFEQVDAHLRKKLMGAGKEAGEAAKWLKVGYSAAIMLIATQVIIKRMIVPFIATPMAGWVKEKFLDKKTQPVHDRIYYDWLAASSARYDNKMDKTAFSNFAA